MNFIKKWWDKFEDWMDEDEEEEEIPVEELIPPDSGIKRVIWNIVDEFELWAKKKRLSPFIVEFIIQIFVIVFYMLACIALTLLCFGIYFLFAGSINKYFLLLMLLLAIITPWLALLLHIIFIPMFPLSLIDSIFSKSAKIRRMSLTIVRPFETALNYFWKSSDLGYIFNKHLILVSCFIMSWELNTNQKRLRLMSPPSLIRIIIVRWVERKSLFALY